jgi:hypothetical protein
LPFLKKKISKLAGYPAGYPAGYLVSGLTGYPAGYTADQFGIQPDTGYKKRPDYPAGPA